ncbi:hypothetical protein CBM2633_B70101 [Cupriavidus taiwanensis]|uniref:hypothetical protein n=1 Tax=Cupriavidus taiwanensis TaxID=164546 RepID=UPI000E1796CF|nr:hypothetical protein [Cupriavidus taiwanensis]SOZ19944.1 hypothetical protein CBM2604_B60120 [Cupriavidus taiwanensis]SOZ33177.1 hypothetical protein CBM2609_B70121 [Cupriavidus taiwanensis]SOZ48490.1 hypothetical protein CBM2610_B50119 [Cupriavidus taiwanensis]SPA01156.1 hypothetical protein CBM2626_B110098 [Cupriavidus taiwanensis]SPA22566.1 hypothetical protein CBM2633_B70101 [Cupriavidus taiwanensis]
MSKALSKYNVPIKERVKVPASGTWQAARTASTPSTTHAPDGRIVEVNRASSTMVTETARKVIIKHNEVIKRLAKR